MTVARGVPLSRRRPAARRVDARCRLVPAVRPRRRPVQPVRYGEVRRRAGRPLRVPAGGVTLPVRGLSFRADQYPDNVWRLREVIRIGESLAVPEHRWALKKLKASDFKEAVVRVMEQGELPVLLRRDHSNPVDPDAVQVWCPYLGDKGFLGYLPARGAHGRLLSGIAATLDEAGPDRQPYRCWVAKVRIHPDNLDNPGIDVHVQPRRRR